MAVVEKQHVDEKERVKKDYSLLIALVLALLALGIVNIYHRIIVNTSPSLSYRFMWRAGGTPQKHDYVTFFVNHELIGAKPVRVSKQLNCWSGDTLTLRGREFFCNGEFMGEAKTRGLKGQEMPLFVFNGVIPVGKVFASGQHPDSFDSRYYGFVDLDNVERIIPLVDAFN